MRRNTNIDLVEFRELSKMFSKIMRKDIELKSSLYNSTIHLHFLYIYTCTCMKDTCGVDLRTGDQDIFPKSTGQKSMETDERSLHPGVNK